MYCCYQVSTPILAGAVNCSDEEYFNVYLILLGSPLAVAIAAATLPAVHTQHET
jgi:hypothetical protein